MFRHFATGGVFLAMSTAALQAADPKSVVLKADVPEFYPQRLAFSPDGKTLVSASNAASNVRVWDVGARKNTATFKYEDLTTGDCAVSPDGKAALAVDGSVTRRWDIKTGKPLPPLQLPPAEDQSVGLLRGMTYSGNGKVLAVGSQQGPVVLWDAATARKTALLNAGPKADKKAVTAIALSPDAKILATGREDGTVVLWDVAGRKSVAVLTGHNKLVVFCGFTPDGKSLVTGGFDSVVNVWEVSTRKSTAVHKLPSFGNDFALSPDGKTWATGHGEDGVIILREVNSGKEVGRAETDAISGVVFSRDGKSLAACSVRAIHIWEVATILKPLDP